MVPHLEGLAMDFDDQKHVFDHRCCMMTTPPWDLCDKNCPGDRENGSDTWLILIDDTNNGTSYSKCWICPAMKNMYPNIRNCNYLEQKYGKR